MESAMHMYACTTNEVEFAKGKSYGLDKHEFESHIPLCKKLTPWTLIVPMFFTKLLPIM